MEKRLQGACIAAERAWERGLLRVALIAPAGSDTVGRRRRHVTKFSSIGRRGIVEGGDY